MEQYTLCPLLTLLFPLFSYVSFVWCVMMSSGSLRGWWNWSKRFWNDWIL